MFLGIGAKALLPRTSLDTGPPSTMPPTFNKGDDILITGALHSPLIFHEEATFETADIYTTKKYNEIFVMVNKHRISSLYRIEQ